MPSVLTEVPGTPTRSLPFILMRPCQVGMMTFLLQLRKRSLRQGPASGPGGYRGGRPARQPPPPSGSASRLPTLHRLGPGSRNGDPKAERHHFKARGRRRPAETGTRGVTRDSRG